MTFGFFTKPKPALIVSGPKDGEFTNHPGQTLKVSVNIASAGDLYKWGEQPPEKHEPLQVLTFKRIIFKVPFSFTYLPVFVPIEWTQVENDSPMLENRILGHLLTNAFKGATA